MSNELRSYLKEFMSMSLKCWSDRLPIPCKQVSSFCSNCSLPVARAAVSIEFVSRVDFILSLAIVICNAFASLGTSRPDKPKQFMFKKSDGECLHQFHVLFRAKAFSQVYNDKIWTIHAMILTSVKLTASYHLSSTFVFTNNNKVCIVP